jgi:hypothetical protein
MLTRKPQTNHHRPACNKCVQMWTAASSTILTFPFYVIILFPHPELEIFKAKEINEKANRNTHDVSKSKSKSKFFKRKQSNMRRDVLFVLTQSIRHPCT